MPDLEDIGDKLTAAKVKKLTLQNTLHLNAQLHKEVSNVERDLTNAESSAKIIREKELDVRQISQATEDGYRQTVALAEILARNISNVEARLNQLSLTKDRSIGIINQKAYEKLSAFPKGTQVQRQHELLAAILAHLATASNQDAETCCTTEEEIRVLQGVINEKTADNTKLTHKMIAIKEEITSITLEIKNSTKLEAQFEENVASSSAILEELQSHLVEISGSIPNEDIVSTSKNNLTIQEVEIADTEKEIAALNTDFNKILVEFDRFKKESNAEFVLIRQSAEKEEVNLDGEIIDLEDEISQTEVMMKGAIQRRDIVMQKVFRSHPGKTLDQLEEELNAAENAEISELEQLKAELEVENTRKTEQEKEMGSELEQLALHLQSEKDLMAVLENDLKHKDEAISKKYNDMMITLKHKKETLQKINSDIGKLEKKKTSLLNSRICPATPKTVRSMELHETQVIAIKMEPSVEEIPLRNIPIIEGIESFSPETKRKREERRKRNSRVIEHSLDYTDLSMDSDGIVNLKSPPKEKRQRSELKRLRMESAKRRESGKQQSHKKHAAQPKVAKLVRMPSSICSVDIEFDDNMNAGVKPPAAFLDDSLFEDDSDCGNVSMDSLFTNSPPKNVRCIPENVFLEQSGYSSLINHKTPPANVSDHMALDDSLDEEGSFDQTVWD